MDLRFDRLTDQDLVELAEHYNDFAGRDGLPASWHWWYGELAERLQVEQARRKIAAAEANDPVGFVWFGKLGSPPP